MITDRALVRLLTYRERAVCSRDSAILHLDLLTLGCRRRLPSPNRGPVLSPGITL